MCHGRAAQNGRGTHEQLVAKAGGKLEKDREDDRSEGESDGAESANPLCAFQPSLCRCLCVRGEAARRGRRVAPWPPFPGGHFRRVGRRAPAGRRGAPMHAWSRASPPSLCAWAPRYEVGLLRPLHLGPSFDVGPPSSRGLGRYAGSLLVGLGRVRITGMRVWPSGLVGSQRSVESGRTTSAEGTHAPLSDPWRRSPPLRRRFDRSLDPSGRAAEAVRDDCASTTSGPGRTMPSDHLHRR